MYCIGRHAYSQWSYDQNEINFHVNDLWSTAPTLNKTASKSQTLFVHILYICCHSWIFNKTTDLSAIRGAREYMCVRGVWKWKKQISCQKYADMWKWEDCSTYRQWKTHFCRPVTKRRRERRRRQKEKDPEQERERERDGDKRASHSFHIKCLGYSSTKVYFIKVMPPCSRFPQRDYPSNHLQIARSQAFNSIGKTRTRRGEKERHWR